MKNKKKTLLGYIFIVSFSFLILSFQAATLNIITPSTISQSYNNYEKDGFLDEDGNRNNPLDIGPSNEEVYKYIMKYLPYAIFVVIGGLIIVILYQHSQLKRVEKPNLIKIENTNAMNESDIYELIPHYDKEKFLNARYNDFIEIKRAYLTDNRFKLKKKLTDQLYSKYYETIDALKSRNETHIIRDTRYRGAIIKNIEQVNTMIVLTLELKVCYYEYIEKNKALVSGNRDKKVVVYYELKFVTDLREFISICPYCGAKSPDTFKRICDYCNQTVEETELNWLLNQENIVIKSYGDDI